MAPGGPVAAEEPETFSPVLIQVRGFLEHLLQGLGRQAKTLLDPGEVQSLGQRRKDGTSLLQTAPLAAS